MEILKLINNFSIFINICIFNTCQYLYFCRKFSKMDKEKRKPKPHLEFTSFTDNKSCKDRYFKFFANRYINIPLTGFWEIVNTV